LFERLTILVVEDDDILRYDLAKDLAGLHLIKEASNREDALQYIQKTKIDIAFIDLTLHGEDTGFELVKKSRAKGIYTVILSGHSENSNFVRKGEENGCHTFMAKPHTAKSLEQVFKEYQAFSKDEYTQRFIEKNYVTCHKDTQRQLSKIKSVYDAKEPVYIQGPSGTGKSFVAKIIHQLAYGEESLTTKGKNPFIKVNCASIPKDLIESNFFGEVEGAHSGASRYKAGYLEQAHNGTLFLDEIGKMPQATQDKLLTALEEKQFYPLGSDKPIKVNIRLISATSDDLKLLISKNLFRLDLYYRIATFEISLYPLKSRPEDVEYQLKYLISNLESRRAIHIDPKAMKALQSYTWPGNSRELHHLVTEWDAKKELYITIETLKNSHPEIIDHKNLLKNENFQYLTQWQFSVAQVEGFDNYISKVAKELTTRLYLKNKQNRILTIKQLKMSKHKFDLLCDKSVKKPRKRSHAR
jgi:DNA-binding NtrC family response regulator